MSTGLQPGNYKIVNGLQGSGSTDLYLTFPGPFVDLIIKPDNSLNTQVWTVTGIAGGKQTITPFTTGFQANGATAGEAVKATTNPCQWNINFDTTMNLYMIQGLAAALVWDLAGSPTDGQSVILHMSATGNLTQYWRFTPA